MRGEAASLPGSSPLVLRRSETQQGEPVRMAFAGHQFPRALADTLGKPTAHDPSLTPVSILSFQFNQVDMGKLSLALLSWDSDRRHHRNETRSTAVQNVA